MVATTRMRPPHRGQANTSTANVWRERCVARRSLEQLLREVGHRARLVAGERAGEHVGLAACGAGSASTRAAASPTSRTSTIGTFASPRAARAYIEELLPDVLEGRIEPGHVFDRVTNLDGVPDGYRAMNECEAIKVMVAF
jgi:Zn-dependent alcohol dehydrogenase